MNILIISVETELGTCTELALELLNQGHFPIILIADTWSVVYASKEIENCIEKKRLSEYTVSIEKVYEQINVFSSNMTKEEVDWGFLDSFQRDYGEVFSIYDLLRCDLSLSDDYHDYDYFVYKANNKWLMYKYLELVAKWLINFMNEKSFNLIFSFRNQGLLKALFFAYANAKNLPYYILDNSRIGNLSILSDTFFIGTSRNIADEIYRLKKTSDSCYEAKKWIENWSKTNATVYDSHLNLISRLENSKSRRVRFFFRQLIWSFRSGLSIEIARKKFRGGLRANYFLPTYWTGIKHPIITFTRMIQYARIRQLNNSRLPTGRYVYFALHRMPENSSSVVCKTLDEIECIRRVARLIPPSWSIVVKVAPGMYAVDGDSRKISYYEELLKIPNVHVMSPYYDNKDILVNSSMVASLSGTALIEAAMLGKPSLRWGEPEFSIIKEIKIFDNLKISLDNEKEETNIYLYIQACLNLGLFWDQQLNDKALHGELCDDDKNIMKKFIDQLLNQIKCNSMNIVPW